MRLSQAAGTLPLKCGVRTADMTSSAGAGGVRTGQHTGAHDHPPATGAPTHRRQPMTDLNASAPRFKVGDRVRIVNPDDAVCYGMAGRIADITDNGAHLVEFEGGDGWWFRAHHISPLGPLGVEPWRLLFRAHRDGWVMPITASRRETSVTRIWDHNDSGQTVTLTLTKRGAK